MPVPARRVIAFVAVLAVVALGGSAVLAACTTNVTRDGAPAPPAPGGDWPMYGHDISRTNYNPDEATIKPANVDQLV
ncbi:MAG TPA: hypothetical protein VM536_22475, partial [Chloroflexia bacterium]|nr:hypothetical protein [Chloroflexia bacterium]